MMTKEEVIRELQKLAKRLGKKTLIGRDLTGSPVSMYWVRHYYDHLADALVDAGLEPSRNAKSYAATNDELLDYLADLWSRLDRRPTTFDLKREGKYSAVLFKNRFGGFPEAIQQLKERERQEEPVEQEESEPITSVSEKQTEIQNALEPVRQLLLGLTEENQRLRASEQESERLRTALGQVPIEKDLFISYSSTDSEEAMAILQKAEERNLSVFLDRKDIKYGSVFRDDLRKNLLRSRELCILVTPEALESMWVTVEWGAAWALNLPVTPILLRCSPRQLPEPLREFQCVDFHKVDRYLDQVVEHKSMS